ncbi:retinitis pigmentosa GTPase regulator b isoform X1 [Misgurnus anguillicaudatus]|uniref:retinitis pigmentosa GTPase regulator b isoform X1 n=1 Tax=Misgurnus anguillicaudatus TaxID=75329 RepID=UPI003CCF1DEF
MAGETEDEIPETGAVFTFGKSKFADNAPSKFWLKYDVPLRISCGDEHTALITENGKLFMFGSNNWGQLGLGTKTTVNKPTCVKALKSERVMLVACGRNHTLVYTSHGNLYASGGNNEGQLGLGDCEDRTFFHQVDFFSKNEPIIMLAAGSNISAALTQGGRLYMWGDNSEGQIGLGKESNALTPREVSVGKRVSWVSCGYYHSAFVTVDGALFTFGEKDSGKLGLPTEKLANHRVPQQVTGISNRVMQVACGGGHTVALTEHELLSFGLGQFGQLGHGTFIFESRLPRVVEHFRRGRVKHVACGENHTAVVTDSGLLYTFGDGRHGKLGLGDENFTNQFSPTLCPRFLNYHIQAVSCGGCHMLVLARPRDENSENVILEEDDVTEDYFEKSYTELLGDTHNQTTLNRSISARVRRRERERSPDQFGQMFRTLPNLSGNQLNSSIPAPNQTWHAHSEQPRKISHNGLQIPSDKNISEDNESVKDLGETTDLLNLTHVMKMDPCDNSLTLSPMQKKKVKVVKVHGKEKGKTCDKRAELSHHKALPTDLLRSSSSCSVVGNRPHVSPAGLGQDKENVLIALEDRKPGRSKTSRFKHTTDQRQLESRERSKEKAKLNQDTVTKAGNNPQQEKPSNVETEHKVAKASTKSNQEYAGKTKHKERPVEVRSRSQKVEGEEKDVKMKPVIVIEHLEQITSEDQFPTGKKVLRAKDQSVKNTSSKGETNTVKTESKQSKNSNVRNDNKNTKTSANTKQSSYKGHTPSKTKSSRPEQSHSLSTEKNSETLKVATMFPEASSTSESESKSEQMLQNRLTEVMSVIQDVGTGSPARLLREAAAGQFLTQSTPQKPKPFLKQRTLSDVSSISESGEVPRQDETRRATVTINVKPEQGSSDGQMERSTLEETSTQSMEKKGEECTEERSEISEEDGEMESSAVTESVKGLRRRNKKEEVDDREEVSESKTLDEVTKNDDSGDDDDDATIKSSSEEEESEARSEEAEGDGIDDSEEETNEINTENENSGEGDESKTSEEEESGEESNENTEIKSERSDVESDEEEKEVDEESEENDSEDEEESAVESKSKGEEEDSEEMDEEDEEDDADEDKSDEDMEENEATSEDDDVEEEEEENETEEEKSDKDTGDEATSEDDEEEEEEDEESDTKEDKSDEDSENEATSEEEEEEDETEENKSEEDTTGEDDEEEEKSNKDTEDEATSEDDEEEEDEKESESEEEEEQPSIDEEEESNNEEEESEEKSTEGEKEEEEESEENEEEEEEVEDQEGEQQDNEEEGEESQESEEDEEEKKREDKRLERKRDKASASTKPKSDVKKTKQLMKATAKNDSVSEDKSQESQQFWDNVLPQYLNLK